MLLSKKIRLQVTDEDAATLEFMQSKCRGLYNWLVMRLRNGEHWHFHEEKAALKECRAYDPALNDVYGKLLAEVYWRLDGAMKAFWKRQAEGVKPAGFPRVRPCHRFFTLCYPAMYVKVEGNTVLLPTGGGRGKKHKPYPTIRAGLTEAPPASYKEVAISRDARGHYYASFVCERAEQSPRETGIIAFDLGIKTLAVGVNEQGHFYHIGGEKGHCWYNQQLDKIRSKRDRCKKKSSRYVHLSQVYKRVSEKKRNKRRDCLHKASHLISHRLVESTVVIGDLSQRQMVTKEHEEHLHTKHRAVYNDWGLYDFVQMLTYKCVLAGKRLEYVDEHDSSKTCSRCGHQQPMPLWKRTYRCPNCGLVLERDENSAVNHYQRFIARLGPHTDDSVRCVAGAEARSSGQGDRLS